VQIALKVVSLLSEHLQTRIKARDQVTISFKIQIGSCWHISQQRESELPSSLDDQERHF
jgi:hypothetical protein